MRSTAVGAREQEWFGWRALQCWEDAHCALLFPRVTCKDDGCERGPTAEIGARELYLFYKGGVPFLQRPNVQEVEGIFRG